MNSDLRMIYKREHPTRKIRDVRAYLDENSIPEPNSGCYLWIGATNRYGYGRFGSNPRRLAHRASYELEYGTPSPDAFVLHKCDNTFCIRPSHLFLGTQQDNMRDACRKGRFVSKLTLQNALDIRGRLSAGETGRSLAKAYSVSVSLISHIKRGTAWRPETYNG